MIAKMPFAEINDKSLFYTDDAQREGSSSQKTTVFIHGLGSSSCFYKIIIPHLQSVTRCIALDTPGSGLSEQSVKSVSSDVIGLLDYLKIEGKVVVVGHSMGGIVASEIAATSPDRVRGVVLIGPVNPQPQLSGVFEQRIEAVKKGMRLCWWLSVHPRTNLVHLLNPLSRWT
jgi:pimeloyl-ACP methyl ester carboxylesterase